MDDTRERLRLIPKVELHRHLEGSLRLSTLVELALAAEARGDEGTMAHVPLDKRPLPPTLPLPLNSADRTACPVRTLWRDRFLIAEKVADLTQGLDKFWFTQSLLATEEIVERVSFEVCEDAFNDGVRLLEVRYAPRFVCINHPSLTYESVHQAVVRGINRACEKFPMGAGILIIIERNSTLEEAEKLRDFILANRGTIAGVDMANDEILFPAHELVPIFNTLKDAGCRITIHAGEVEGNAAMHVRDAVDKWGAERIGHGIHVVQDPDTMAYLKEKGVHLEVSLTSNVLCNTVPSVSQHPIKRLIDAGLSVGINSDDPGLFDIDLLDDYLLLGDAGGPFAFSLADFERCNTAAAHASFLPEDVKKRFYFDVVAKTTKTG